MFSKIILATDLSPASHAVVRCAAGLYSLGARQCILLQCLNMPDPAVPGAVAARQTVERELAAEKALLEEAGIETEVMVVPGYAQVEINRVARDRHCSLIVIGSHGRTLLNEMLLGGVATAVLHHAVSPVLVVRVKRSPDGGVFCECAEEKEFLRHVLCATDFSENSSHAFRYVKYLASWGARQVTLLHVQDKTRIAPHLMHRLEEFNETDRGRLEALRTQLSGVETVHLRIPFGVPTQEILKEVRAADVSLIVMGTQGRGFVSELFLGSVSHNVARNAPCPVLLVPAPGRCEG